MFDPTASSCWGGLRTAASLPACSSRRSFPPRLRASLSLQRLHRENRLPASGSHEFLRSIVPEASSANMHRTASSVRYDGYVYPRRPGSEEAHRTQKCDPHASSEGVLRIVDWSNDSP